MNDFENEKVYWNAFNLIPQLGPQKIKKIYNYFQSLKSAWSRPVQEFQKAGLNKKDADLITEYKNKINPEQEYKKIADQDVKILTLEDSQYPNLLKQIHSPPAVLYIRGQFVDADDFSIGVVGTRKPSYYGKTVTNELVKGLVQNNITIVSGLALGIDTEAHHSALQINGRTIAVLGSGLDWPNIYPRVNVNLVKKIIDDHGAVISEFPIGTEPSKFNFPRRNRIISGLSKGVVIIEAGEKSGALITATQATDQDREVFVVPGEIYKANSKGTNNLIKQGAKLVTCVDDILEELEFDKVKKFSQARKTISEDPTEQKILDLLNKEPLHKDVIIQELDISTSQILSILSLMEMKGMVKDVGGGKYVVI